MTVSASTGADEPGRLLRAMLSIPSVSGQEGAVATFLAEQMARLGLRSSVDAVGNVHGVIGPVDAPTVMLLGHIDTVPGVVPVCRVGDLLYGRGAVDAKGAIVAMTHAATRARDVRVHVVGAVGEEVAGARGARHVMASVPRPDAVVIGEPSGWEGVCLGYKGRVGVHYEIERPLQHTSSPEPTAVAMAAEFARMVEDQMRAASDGGEPVGFANAQATLVRLTGDLGRAEALLTCRVPPGFDFAAFEARARRFPHTRVELDEQVPAVRRTRHDVVVSRLRAAIAAHGGSPVLKLKAGTSDMNTIEPWQVPMAAYGPGDAHLDHTDDEHIPLPELSRSVEVLTTALDGMGARLAAEREQGTGDRLGGGRHRQLPVGAAAAGRGGRP